MGIGPIAAARGDEVCPVAVLVDDVVGYFRGAGINRRVAVVAVHGGRIAVPVAVDDPAFRAAVASPFIRIRGPGA
jgi:hypothetical protein